jgi:hypothetical protein
MLEKPYIAGEVTENLSLSYVAVEKQAYPGRTKYIELLDSWWWLSLPLETVKLTASFKLSGLIPESLFSTYM